MCLPIRRCWPGLSWPTFRWAFTSHTGGLWQPLTMLSYLVDVRLFGPSPGAMHLENVIIHALSAVAWYVLLSGMTGARSASLMASAIFALHPAHVESVAWITERKDMLSMLMLVCSLIAYWRYTIRLNWLAYIFSLLFFSMALMSKAMMVTQPALLLLLDLWPLGRMRLHAKTQISSRRLFVEKAPFLGFSIAAGVITLMAQSMQGAAPDLQQLSVSDRVNTVLLGYVRYLGTAFWPRRLSVYYPYQFGPPTMAAFASAALLLLISAIAWRLRRHRPYLLVGWAWYLITLLPVIGIVQVGNQSLADRFTYLPFVGLSIAVVWAVADLVQGRPRTGAAALALGCTALIACAAATRDYLSCWTDTVSLFSRAEQSIESPDWNIEYHLAESYRQSGRLDQAVEHYDAALRLNPNHLSSQTNLANILLPHFPELALPHYEKAVQIAPSNWTAHYDYSLCLKALKQDAAAEIELEKARRLK